MFYPKKKEKNLSPELFRNPTSEYRGTPFWAWNCELDKDELLRQLDVLKQMGMGGAHMHVRTGMATTYLSDEYMDLIKSCVEKCRQENMLAWLYDEDRWPSGGAGGLVTKDPQYRARQLLITTTPYASDGTQGISFEGSGKGGTRSENGHLVACYDVVLDDDGFLARYRRIEESESAKGQKWYVYLEIHSSNPWFNNETYVDTLNPKAIQRFMELTHERYFNTVGKDFGGVIPAIFTDEPQFTCKKELTFSHSQEDVFLPWTDDVPQTYRDAYGEDILEKFPEILWELPNGRVSATRYRYHEHIAERFASSFADQLGKWCDAHGLMLTGHMMEEPTLQSQTEALGEAMRSYRSFQLPGIDMLCDKVELTTAKQAQSAARQYGREGVLSELYGVTGWDFDFRGHKFQGDWQAALGITVRVHHLAWVSMKGEAKRDYPASINYQSPWWQDYAFVEDHFARVNTAMTRGKADVRIGVIHPVESYWLHKGPNDKTAGICAQLDKNFQDVTRWLLEGCLDFDFICESLLPSLCTKGGAPLQVGEMAYDAIVVPGCETLRSTTLERLEAFREAGGRLIFLGDAPKYENALDSSRGVALWNQSQHIFFGEEQLLEALKEYRQVEIRNHRGMRTNDLIYQLRCDGEDRWLFIAHSQKPYHPDIPQKQETIISLKGEYGVVKYDTQTGQIIPLASQIKDGKTCIQVELFDLDSLLLRYTKQPVQLPEKAQNKENNCREIYVPKLVKYTLDEPNVLLLDKAEMALDGEAYRPEQELLRGDNALRTELGWPTRQNAVAQPWVVKEPRPEHIVKLRFTVRSALDIPNIKMALEDADIAKIWLNGSEITAKPEGWFVDKSIGTVAIGTLPAGENTIEVALPFGRRTNVEWCYLLGDFGVQVCGEHRQLIPRLERLGFSDVTGQGLAYYGGNITYHIDFATHGGKLQIVVPHFVGTAVRVALSGGKNYIAYPPYRLTLDDVPAGDHTLELTLLGNRQNCFGPVHRANVKNTWIGPDSWRTREAYWTESYRLKPLGITSAPKILEIK